MKTMACALLLIGFASTAQAETPVVSESNGLVVIEVEATASELGQWKRGDKLKGYSGKGYLEFTGNKPTNGPPKSPLEFRFKIRHSGLYYLHLRCARDTSHGQPNDHSNDCYVRVEGDYEAGPNAGDKHGNDAPLAMLKRDTKLYGGDANRFSWATGNRLDPGGGWAAALLSADPAAPDHRCAPGHRLCLRRTGRQPGPG